MIPQTTGNKCYRTLLLLLCVLNGVLTFQGGCAIVDLSPGSGNATVSAIPPETIRQLRSQGISDAVFKQFFKVLDRNKIPPDQLDPRLRKMAELYLAQKTLLMQFSSEDPEVASFLRLARQALEIPEFSLAEEILNEASQQDEQAAQNLPQSATTRLTSAAIAQNTNGNLQVVQLSFVKAQAYYRKALTLLPSSNKEYRGNVLVNLANAIAQGGIGIEGENIQNSLRDAVATYRLALTLLTKEEFPQQWASTQRSLGIALSQHGERTTGAESTRLHQAAETAYREALTVYTKEQFPQDSALTQGLLGSVLANQGFRPNGEAGAQLFAGAVQAYREALTIDAKNLNPREWARTQLNLGIALWEQARRVEGKEELKSRLFVEAVQAYREALTVYSKDQYPQDWAMTQIRLGKALGDQGFRAGGEAGKELLHQAINALELALEVWTREAFPAQWEETMGNLKIVKKVLNDMK